MTESTTQSLRFQVQSKEQRQFYATLNKRVNRFFKDQQLSKKANTEMIVKTIVFITAYVGGFGLILALQPGWTLALILWALQK
jgi:linoleoyl-CoA desaturase